MPSLSDSEKSSSALLGFGSFAPTSSSSTLKSGTLNATTLPASNAAQSTASTVAVNECLQLQPSLSLTWPGYVALVISILGWGVTHVLSARREVRKERRVEVDSICKIVSELLAMSQIYYAESESSVKSRLLASEIRFEIQRICKRVERLQKRCPEFAMDAALDNLMESITGGDFDSAKRAALELGSSILVDIENACHFAIDSLEDGFSRTYPDNWLWRFRRR